MSESVFVRKSEIKKKYNFFKDKKLLCPEAYIARTLNLEVRDRQRDRKRDRKRVQNISSINLFRAKNKYRLICGNDFLFIFVAKKQ
jgi:hypothetical protein